LVVSFIPIPELFKNKVRFIAAKLGSSALSEFEKFDEKTFTKPHHIREQQIIYKTIEQVGRRGAKEFYFRPESGAHALPGQVDQDLMDANPDDFGIRVYCGLLREDLVLLLNGDVKTKLDPNDCPNVGPHFRLAKRLVNALLKAEREGFIRFTSGGIEMDDDYEFEI